MMNCKDIENNLPLYLDNLLSAADKRAVEEHLKSCPQCAKALIQFQKTRKLVDGLGEVEPPSWFKYRIMARVREEAEKKSFAEKWFYPLRIKIPIQVFATIFITVLAVYIYRAGNEQFNEVLSPQAPTPVIKVEKDQLPRQSTKAPEAVMSTVTKVKVADIKNMQDEKVVMYDVSSGAAAPKTQELKKEMPQENVRAGAVDMAKAMKGDAAVDKNEASYVTLSEKQAEPARAMPLPSVELERKKEGYVLDASMKQSRAPEAQSMMPKAAISLRVANINTAVGEVEKLLVKYEAKKVIKQMPEGKAILTAELKAQNMKDLIAQLKTIGRVEERGITTDTAEGDIQVVIEVKNQ